MASGMLARMIRQAPLLFCAAALFAACASREVVVVYSPHGADVLRDYEKLFEEAYPNVDVQWIAAGAKEVYGRIAGERNRPACDVWWGAPSTMFMQAADAGLLATYRPTWAEQAPPDAHDPQHRWYATYRSPLAILFNTNGLDRAQAPQTWDDLLDPRWRGKIVLRKPLASGTMRTFLCAMVGRAGNEDDGIAWLRRLQESVVSSPESPNLLYDHIKRNPDCISVWLQPDVIMQRERNGFPFDCVVPPQTPVLLDAIAIVNNAPHPEWARAFYEFVTSPEALAQQARAYAKMPARKDIDPAQLPAWMTGAVIDPMPIDWAVFAAKEAAWCDRWEREVFRAP